MKNEKTLEDFILFIRSEVGENSIPIITTSRIEDDLGITGDDAENFIRSYSKIFDVDINGFKFSKYFYSEPSWGWLFLSKKTKESLTVGDLYNGIMTKKLE